MKNYVTVVYPDGINPKRNVYDTSSVVIDGVKVRVPEHMRKDYLGIKEVEKVDETKPKIIKQPKPRKKIKVSRSKRIKNWKWLHLRGWMLIESNYTCRDCGSPASIVHHIKPVSEFPELQLEKSNLVVVCNDCHKKRHINLPEVLFNVNQSNFIK